MQRVTFVILILILISTATFFVYNKGKLRDSMSESANKTLVKYASIKTKIDDASLIPKGAEKYLPKKGFLLVSGGSQSVSRRLAVDVDLRSLSYAVSQNMNQTPYEKSKEEQRMVLPEQDLQNLVSIADKIWASDKDFSSNIITADFNVLLILADDGKVKVINSYGPPVDEVNELYELAWNLASKDIPTSALEDKNFLNFSTEYANLLPNYVKIGEEKSFTEIPELKIKLLDVINDGRCPGDVDCTHSGWVTVLVEASYHGVVAKKELYLRGGNSNVLRPPEAPSDKPGSGNVFSIDQYTVYLVALNPYPITTKKIEKTQYEGIFLVDVVKK